MNAEREIQQTDLADLLLDILTGAQAFVRSRQTPGAPFGRFNHNHLAIASAEVSAGSVAMELWRMLGLPISEELLQQAYTWFASMQVPETGLICDPSWANRAPHNQDRYQTSGDSFFTRCVVAALQGWDRLLPYPVSVFANGDQAALVECIQFEHGGHGLFSIGDAAVLIDHNVRLGVLGADELQAALCTATLARQDSTSGLFIEPLSHRSAQGSDDFSWTHHINRTFHTIKYTLNVFDTPLPHANSVIDRCLDAAHDQRFYAWDTGYACNDLDLAHVLYTARCASAHRSDDVAAFARQRLPMMVAIRKADGGFSFRHETTMTEHSQLQIGPARSLGDLWGTLMYLGTIKMLVHMGYPEVSVPWGFAQVHAVPSVSLKW